MVMRSPPISPPSPVPGADPAFEDPVFVLCNGRSGSTLLRFLLDAHPDLACPPETNLPALCVQLATVWSLIEGAPLSPNRGDEPPGVPEAAIAGVRATLDSMLGPYLRRRGKKRYCDKSLSTARFAGLLMRVYPGARFICLYRHPMDVIASGIEACPWGLNGYGFDSYIASTPGNAVLAIARFWTENVAAMLEAEKRFPDRCLRVRYEDLVTDAEETAARIFAFIDAPPAPGISRACFSSDRERFGPGDHKIWFTSEVSAGSIGRGWSVPAAMIPPPVLDQVNELAAALGYRAVGDGWGTSAPPADVRVPRATGTMGSLPGPDRAGMAGEPPSPAASRSVGQRLEAGMANLRPGTAARVDELGDDAMVAVCTAAGPGGLNEHWLVDFKNRAVRPASPDAQEQSAWDVIGSADAWEDVISRRQNLSVALRAGRLRYCDQDESAPAVSDARLRVLADLLGLTDW
jgi:sulfotransferase family protein